MAIRVDAFSSGGIQNQKEFCPQINIQYFLMIMSGTLPKLAISKVQKFEYYVPFLCTKLFQKKGHYSRGTLFKGEHY